ncbi:C26 family cysteine hydrolase domain-containing family [Microbacterium sp. 4R-513]|uniref:membrane dipeptidase n=1 Tax=Microbacterium sp. 4R-513 TaxID=2567934 RepID=UPI0013E128A6|nr:membrane dipeptidase [Microbacterium sp. 4R-513]QIG39496.1 C26 family cysteine hydrolase domain-containing family [Microbacterium sp. 4R-513]
MSADVAAAGRRAPRARVLIVVNSAGSGPGNLVDWLDKSAVTCTIVEDARIPDTPDRYDGVVLLGGGLLPYDDDRAPWLARERRLAMRCIEEGVPLLGICLGAQLLAAVADGAVQGAFGTPERGLVRIRRRPESGDDPLLDGLDPVFPVLQNHRDQITSLPPGAVHLAEGDDCAYQAFRIGRTAWGVQFHPEAPVSRLDDWDEAALRDEGVDLASLRVAAGEAEPELRDASWRLVANFSRIVVDTARTRPLLVIDGHNDLLWEMRERRIDPHRFVTGIPELQTDLDRLRRGGVGAQFWSVWVPDGTPRALQTVLEQVDRLGEVVEAASADLEITPTAADVRSAIRRGRIGCLIGSEGAHCLEGELANVASLARAGVRYMTLTHNASTMWADSATDVPLHDGLSVHGAQLVAELERCGVLVDLSHTSVATMHDVLDIASVPLVFSHSSTQAVTAHDRNVPDDVLRRLRDNGGVQMITFVPAFVTPSATRGEAAHGTPDPASIARLVDVADHIEHSCDVAGIAHVGIGGDFDGTTLTPDGLGDVSAYPALFAELRRRGWTPGELIALASGNILRVLEATDAAFRRARDISNE